MKTIKVKPWGKDQGEYVLINADDFDDEIHELFTSQSEEKKVGIADLRKILDDAGVNYDKGAKKQELQELVDSLPAK